MEILKLLERPKRAVSCSFLNILGIVDCLFERIGVVTAEYDWNELTRKITEQGANGNIVDSTPTI